MASSDSLHPLYRLPATGYRLPATGYRLPATSYQLLAAVTRTARRLTLAAARTAAGARAAFRARLATRGAGQRQSGQRKQRRCDQSYHFRFHGILPLNVKKRLGCAQTRKNTATQQEA
jgi:hypothetical protein